MHAGDDTFRRASVYCSSLKLQIPRYALAIRSSYPQLRKPSDDQVLRTEPYNSSNFFTKTSFTAHDTQKSPASDGESKKNVPRVACGRGAHHGANIRRSAKFGLLVIPSGGPRVRYASNSSTLAADILGRKSREHDASLKASGSAPDSFDGSLNGLSDPKTPSKSSPDIESTSHQADSQSNGSLGSRASYGSRPSQSISVIRSVESRIVFQQQLRNENARMLLLARQREESIEQARIAGERFWKREQNNVEWESLFQSMKCCPPLERLDKETAIIGTRSSILQDTTLQLRKVGINICGSIPFGHAVFLRIAGSLDSFIAAESAFTRSFRARAHVEEKQNNFSASSGVESVLSPVTARTPLLLDDRAIVLESNDLVLPTDQFSNYPPGSDSWTPQLFSEAVRDTISGSYGVTGDKPSQEAGDKVLQLRRLFKVATVFRIATPATFVSAIQYLVEHNSIVDALEIFQQVQDHISPPLDPIRAHNPFLRQAAKLQDVNMFGDHLMHLLNSNIQPDADTWATLLTATSNGQDKQRVLREMHRRGYFRNTNVANRVAPEIISYSFGTFLDSEGTIGATEIASYMDTLTATFGPIWLSSTALHRMLSALARRLCYEPALDLIDRLAATGSFDPTIKEFNALIEQAKWQRGLPVAVHLLQRAIHEYNILPDSATMNLLFACAWHCGSANVAKCIWKYRLLYKPLNSGDDYYMRHRIFKGLRLGLLPEFNKGFLTDSEREKSILATVIVGRKAVEHRPFQSNDDRVKSAADFLGKEREVYGNLLPQRSFGQVLQEALARDEHESFKEAIREGRGDWAAENAVEVPIAEFKAWERKMWREGKQERRNRMALGSAKYRERVRTGLRNAGEWEDGDILPARDRSKGTTRPSVMKTQRRAVVST